MSDAVDTIGDVQGDSESHDEAHNKTVDQALFPQVHWYTYW